MLQTFEFKAGGETYRVCFTARARYHFESLAGYPLTELRPFSGRAPSDVELTHLVCAGLEGARRRDGDRKKSWTVDEVLDDVLADEGGDVRGAILEACIKAVGAAFATAAAAEAAESTAGKATTGA